MPTITRITLPYNAGTLTGASPALNISNLPSISGGMFMAPSTSGQITGTPGIEASNTGNPLGVTITPPSATIITGGSPAATPAMQPMGGNWLWLLIIVAIVIALYYAFKK